MTYATSTWSSTAGGRSSSSPEFLLADVDQAVDRGRPRRPGSGSVPWSMPCPATPAATSASWPRSRAGPASTSSPPTGLHHDRYYRPTHWGHAVGRGAGRAVHRRHRRGHRRRRLRRPGRPPDAASRRDHQGRRQRRRDRPRATVAVFEAAAAAHRATGCPILTHCEGRHRRRSSRSRLLTDAGRRRRATWRSRHVDKVVDRGYHRELLATGVFVEYDQAFRWPAAPTTARSSCSAGCSRTARATRSCSASTPRARATGRVRWRRPGWPSCSATSADRDGAQAGIGAGPATDRSSQPGSRVRLHRAIRGQRVDRPPHGC